MFPVFVSFRNQANIIDNLCLAHHLSLFGQGRISGKKGNLYAMPSVWISASNTCELLFELRCYNRAGDADSACLSYPQQPQPPPQKKPNYLAVGCISLLVLSVVIFVTNVSLINRPHDSASRTSASGTTSSTLRQIAPAHLPGIRERVNSAGVELVVCEAMRSKTAVPYMETDKGYTYILADVIVKNASRDEQTPYNVLYFKVKDNDGVEYSAEFGTGKGELTHGELSKGEEVRGILAFEVPEKARGLTLSYKPMVIFGGYEPIRIALE